MRRVVLGGMLLFCVAAAPTTPEIRSGPQAPSGPPALELRKVLNFLLETKSLPGSGDDLANILAAGLKKRLVLPPGASPVLAVGGAFPDLQRLSIDFSHAYINSDRRVPRLRPLGPFEQLIRAREFQVIADPMNVDGAAMRLQLRAQDVDLAVQRDRWRNPILVFNNAKQGEVLLQTTTADLTRIFHASANHRGKKYGLDVKRTILRLSSDNEQQLKADLRLISTLVLFPVQLHMTARVDVDDQGMATISNLTCDGSDLAGWLISGMIKPALQKYDGKTIPLVSFPSEKVRINDVRVTLDGENIRVGAMFGS